MKNTKKFQQDLELLRLLSLAASVEISSLNFKNKQFRKIKVERYH